MKLLLSVVALMACLSTVLTSDTCDEMDVLYCDSCWNPPMLCYGCGYMSTLRDDKSGCEPCDDSACMECHIDGDAVPCDRCLPLYMLKDGACESCGTNCLTCGPMDDTDVVGTICAECFDRFEFSNMDASACVSCGSNCQTCRVDDADAVTCSACIEGHMLDTSKGKCTSCPKNCLTCSFDTDGKTKICSACSGRYKLNNDGSKCISCQTSCIDCVDAESTLSSSIAECSACMDGYYKNIDDNPTCNQCLDDCKICSETGKCDTCDDDFYLNSGDSCSECPFKCKTCSEIDGVVTCDVCKDKFALKSATAKTCDVCPGNCDKCTPVLAVKGQCTTCADYFYRDSSKKCQSCPSNCVDCSSGTSCNSGDRKSVV